VKLLHPFQYDPNRTDIVEVATVEKQFFTVESVLAHRWRNKNVAQDRKGQTTDNLELQIKWVGYEIPEWNRYNDASIKKVQVVMNYLEHNNLNHLIPRHFRKNKGKRGRPPGNRGSNKRHKS
jgi:hypothetical protein